MCTHPAYTCGVGRVRVELISNSRRLRRLDGGEEVDGRVCRSGWRSEEVLEQRFEFMDESSQAVKARCDGMRLGSLTHVRPSARSAKVHLRSFAYLTPSGNGRCLRIPDD